MDIKDKEKRSRPPNITPPRRGPLILQNNNPPSQSLQRVASVTNKTRHGNHIECRFVSASSARREEAKERQRKGLLTRFPVSVSPRPMDMIEHQLGETKLTWCQLKYNVQMISEQSSQQTSAGQDGEDRDAESAVLRHRMKYTGLGSHGNDPLLTIERYTHTMSSGVPAGPGKMNVSITHSRKQTQLGPGVLTQHSVAPSNHSWNGWETLPKKEIKRTKEEDTNLRTHSRLKVNTDALKDNTESNQSEERQGSPPIRSRSSTPATEHKTPRPIRLHLPSVHVGPSIAPASLRAVATHRLRPITSNTMIKGRALVV